jgi:hypothetical protein
MAGDIQLNSTSFASESNGTITVNNATLASAVDLSNHYASTPEVQGTHTTFSGSHSDTATTINLASVSGISAGDYVVGEGITPGTTVSSVGASSVVISAGLDTDSVGIAGGEPISFYKSNKVLSPGLVAGGLCRAWVHFNGTGTVAIQASHNVSSITDRGQGKYTLHLATAMPDANYSGVVSAIFPGASSTNRSAGLSPVDSSSAYCNTWQDTSSSLVDVDVICAAIFR